MCRCATGMATAALELGAQECGGFAPRRCVERELRQASTVFQCLHDLSCIFGANLQFVFWLAMLGIPHGRAHTDARTYARTRALTHARGCTHAPARTHTHAYTRTRLHTHTRSCTHVRKYATRQTHACTCACEPRRVLQRRDHVTSHR